MPCTSTSLAARIRAISLAGAALTALGCGTTGKATPSAPAYDGGSSGVLVDASPSIESGAPGSDTGSSPADSGATPADAAPLPNPIADGPVRFSVLSPTLIRAEYAADGAFTDAATFNAVARPLAASGFTTTKSNGWIAIATSKMTLRYREGSGRFGFDNLSIALNGDADAGGTTTASPHFYDAVCPEGVVCEAESATLAGGTRAVANHLNYAGPGFVDRWEPSASATWNVQGVTPGKVALQLRYANASSGPVNLTWTTSDGGAGTFALPVLSDWDTWGVATASFTATNASFGVTVTCTGSAVCQANVDALSVTAEGAAYPTAPLTNPLGGWRRALDSFAGKVPLYGGLFTRDGWFLLDDSQTALWDGASFPTARPNADDDHQDGYIFGYGSDYAQGLRDLVALSGPAPMLPRYAFGVLFSEYFAYHDTDWENAVVPAFRAHTTPLDGIGVDTDWKSPSNWDGWNWNPTYFPDPKGFATWAAAQNIHPLVNIHPAIDANDPAYASVTALTGALPSAGSHLEFDLGQSKDVEAFAALHKPLIDLGLTPWLDWCCDEVAVSVPGLLPDGWINQLYASWPAMDGRRGFSLSRAGAMLGPAGYPAGNDGLFPAGPWSDHRATVQFTGDTFPSWDMLAFEAEMTAAEAAIGLFYVSHDIGSFHAAHLAPEDLYARWVQLGVFQPVLRLHSDHGDRLPWEYGADVEASAEQFLRLREAMLPYNYTLGSLAHSSGAPLARPLWYVFPGEADAYSNPTEFMWGDSLLVAPVTAPVTAPATSVTTTLWLPPGQWIAFTDAGLPAQTLSGPGKFTITSTVASMPVFARAGAIVPLQSYTDNAATAPATLEPRVFGGADGTFTLYEDAGEGFGYASSESATTLMTLSGNVFTIAGAKGTYPGAPTNRAYRVLWANVAKPASVTVNGALLPALPSPSSADGWSYDATARTVTIQLAARPVSAAIAIQVL
jgi:hypothetical protein